MDNKEKVLIGAVGFLAGATVGFLLAPIKNKISLESFSCNTFEDLKSNSDLEESEAKNNETSEDGETEEAEE
ncbi:hypothetical protein H8S20_05470 [Clostridium sp. NSJ-6]|uniref:YtxH domain-containing protein n=1 Tax=Clostridium hominis TaxID=2763036 RepID=A0ABR7DAC2_9CLOT|nr:hypothetical protein [Clostridium hominis]MBC5628341.1 hypothetical protein [Clostridium hominis]MDU2670969.1 hypothetical protein [Clostridium sp.]